MLTFQAKLKEFWVAVVGFLPFSLFHTDSWGKLGKRLRRRLFCKYSKWGRQIRQIKPFFTSPLPVEVVRKRVRLCVDSACVNLVGEKALIRRVQRNSASLVSAVSLFPPPWSTPPSVVRGGGDANGLFTLIPRGGCDVK